MSRIAWYSLSSLRWAAVLGLMWALGTYTDGSSLHPWQKELLGVVMVGLAVALTTAWPVRYSSYVKRQERKPEDDDLYGSS